MGYYEQDFLVDTFFAFFNVVPIFFGLFVDTGHVQSDALARHYRDRCGSRLSRCTKSVVTERVRQILGSRCAAAGPLGVAWPLVVPCWALMRKPPRFRRFFFSRRRSFCPRSQGRAPQVGEERDGLRRFFE